MSLPEDANSNLPVPAGSASPVPPDQATSASPESDAPTYNHSRTGRIARLPKELRDKVNQMLLDGVPFRRIIESLGGDGKEINEDNVGDWKKGGYKEWLLEMQRVDDLSRTR